VDTNVSKGHTVSILKAGQDIILAYGEEDNVTDESVD
jgi:hypothetical protein